MSKLQAALEEYLAVHRAVAAQGVGDAGHRSPDEQDHQGAQHDCPAAGVKETLYRKFEREPLRVLTISGPLPNFAFAALPSLSSRVRDPFVQALLRLKPHANTRDADMMKGWDDEIRNGFMHPAQDYLPSVLNVLGTYREIMHEDQ